MLIFHTNLLNQWRWWKKKQVHLKNHRMAMKLIISQSANKKKNRKKTKRKFQITQFHMNKIPN